MSHGDVDPTHLLFLEIRKGLQISKCDFLSDKFELIPASFCERSTRPPYIRPIRSADDVAEMMKSRRSWNLVSI